MARKPCKIKVTLPTGKQVYPALGKELSEKFGTNKGDEILQSVLSKEFFQYFGNFIANPKSEFFEGKLDKQGMPLLEHVLDFKQKVLDQKKENLKEKYLGKKTKEVTDLKLKYIQQSIDTLNVQIKEFNRTKGAELYIDNLKEIEKLLESYTEAENKKAFITFLDNAADQAAKILQQLDNIGKISQVEWQNKKVRDQKAKLVQDMYKYIKGYGDLADGILNDYNSKAEEAEGLDIITEDELEVLEELQVAGNRIENKYKIAAANILAHEYAPHFTTVKQKVYVEKYRKDFQEKNPIEGWLSTRKLDGEKVSQEKYEAARDEYVWEQLEKDKSEIYTESVNWLKDIFHTSTGDISRWDQFMVALGRQKDSVAQLLSEKFDVTDDKIRQELLIKVTDLYGLTKAYEEHRKKEIGALATESSELYAPFLELDDDGLRTGHFVEKYKSEVYREKKKILEESFAENISEKEGKEMRRQWFKENWSTDKKYSRLIASKKVEEARQYQKEQAAKGIAVSRPKAKWENPQYNELLKSDEAVLNLYKYLMDLQRGADLIVPGHYKLGSKIYQIRKLAKERILTDSKDAKTAGMSVWDSFKEYVREAWLVQEDDEIRGEEKRLDQEETDPTIEGIDQLLEEQEGQEVYADVQGDVRRYIPIHGRSDVGLENMSFNVVDLVLKNYATALHFHEYNNVLPEVQMIEYFMKKRQVPIKEGYDNVYNKAKKYFTQMFKQGQGEGKEGTSNSYQLIREHIDQRVFQINAQGWMGKSTKIGKDMVVVDPGDGKLVIKKAKEVSNAKIINNIGTYAGALLLQFNWIATGANYNYGQAMSQIEAIGGYHWNGKNLMTSYYKFINGTPGILNDIGKRKPQSFVGLILEKYDAMNNFSIRGYNFADTHRFTQLAKGDSLWATISLPEYFNHGVPAMAFLDNIKVFDKDGNYLTKGGTTKDIKKAMSLLDAHERVEDENGVFSLKLDDRVASTSIDGKSDPNKTAFVSKHIVRPLQLINGYLQGHYAKNNKNAAEFKWWGTLMFSMRRFMIPGFAKRWRNVSKIWSEKANMPNLQNYQMGLNTEMDGDYVTTIKFFKNVLKDLHRFRFKLAGMSQREWNTLNSYEKAQIRRTIGEVGFMVVTGVLGSVLAASADEEDDPLYYAMALWANRLNSELMQYTDPREFLRILGSPAVSITLIERILRLGDQFIDDNLGFGPYEVYKTGKRKGETKMKYRFRDVIPWWKQLEKHKDLKEAMEYYTRGNAKFGR